MTLGSNQEDHTADQCRVFVSRLPETTLFVRKDATSLPVKPCSSVAHQELLPQRQQNLIQSYLERIYTAAKEIEQAGGKCLPCIVDVRDETSVKKAIDETVKKFGGIDILINNASAISLTPSEQTDMKRYDLMHSINTRGTFLLSKLCIPLLKKGKNPHILNISPPLDMSPKWFAPHVAYTMSKFGMSMCVLGMHEELRDDGVAANTLWPRTMVWTSAVENVLYSGENKNEVRNASRKPEIMADAAYLILKKPSRAFTGQFLIDDTFLASEGLKPQDFLQYAYDPNVSPSLDFFVPDQYPDPMQNWSRQSKI
ncbi:hypothetical protein M3Y97_00137600 [Aphelenchoides bicaudatus]|nr:hypothetical protein M3Y97_00137600 [Aphelenchoides bicaudatus]